MPYWAFTQRGWQRGDERKRCQSRKQFDFESVFVRRRAVSCGRWRSRAYVESGKWKPLARSRGQKTDKSWCKQDEGGKDCSKRKVLCLEWNWCEHRASGGIESVAVPSDGGAEGCRSYLGREFQSTWSCWVKDLSVTLRREQTEGRWRVMMLEERVVRLDWTLRRLWR